MKVKIVYMYETGDETFDDHVMCPECQVDIQPVWESAYNGNRATCTKCGANWPES